MKLYIFIIIIIASTHAIAQTINVKGYFLLRENQIDHFTGKFVPGEKDPNFNDIQIPVPPPPSGRSYNDTIIDKREITYKTINIEGQKAYYAIETEDTLKGDALIGSSHFLSCALMFKHDTVFLAPSFTKPILQKLKLSNFKYYIPPMVKKSDTIVIIDGKKRLLLYNFKKVMLFLNGKEIKDCLNIKIIERWPDAVYSGSAWLSKKYGVLKWIRSTGRIETRDL